MVGQVVTQLQLMDQYGLLKRGVFYISGYFGNIFFSLVSMYLNHEFRKELVFECWLIVVEF